MKLNLNDGRKNGNKNTLITAIEYYYKIHFELATSMTTNYGQKDTNLTYSLRMFHSWNLHLFDIPLGCVDSARIALEVTWSWKWTIHISKYGFIKLIKFIGIPRTHIKGLHEALGPVFLLARSFIPSALSSAWVCLDLHVGTALWNMILSGWRFIHLCILDWWEAWSLYQCEGLYEGVRFALKKNVSLFYYASHMELMGRWLHSRINNRFPFYSWCRVSVRPFDITPFELAMLKLLGCNHMEVARMIKLDLWLRWSWHIINE